MTTQSPPPNREKKNPYFNPDLYKRAIGITWWEHILLFFHITYVAIDFGTDGYNHAVFYKKMNNKVYIVGEERLPTMTSFKHKGRRYTFPKDL